MGPPGIYTPPTQFLLTQDSCMVSASPLVATPGVYWWFDRCDWRANSMDGCKLHGTHLRAMPTVSGHN